MVTVKSLTNVNHDNGSVTFVAGRSAAVFRAAWPQGSGRNIGKCCVGGRRGRVAGAGIADLGEHRRGKHAEEWEPLHPEHVSKQHRSGGAGSLFESLRSIFRQLAEECVRGVL